jgi:hypothetical protein
MILLVLWIASGQVKDRPDRERLAARFERFKKVASLLTHLVPVVIETESIRIAVWERTRRRRIFRKKGLSSWQNTVRAIMSAGILKPDR